jgi:RNA recognition motif-containing protein
VAPIHDGPEGGGKLQSNPRHFDPVMADIDATKAKSTVFIGGLAQTVDENVLLEAFAPFGEDLFYLV